MKRKGQRLIKRVKETNICGEHRSPLAAPSIAKRTDLCELGVIPRTQPPPPQSWNDKLSAP